MAEGDGFLSRWSRRKQEVKEGKPLQEPPAWLPPPPEQGGGGGGVAVSNETVEVRRSPHPNLPPQGEGADTPLPTMEDIGALTPQSDFKPFMARGVAPEVKNAAMKKLFADPHFNTMDRLDIYIDDYSKPDPMPASMLRQLASAKFLKMFDEEEEEKEKEKEKEKDGAGDDANTGAAPDVAQSPLCNELPSQPPASDAAASRLPDADPDLRLQQDHAAGPPGPGRGTA